MDMSVNKVESELSPQSETWMLRYFLKLSFSCFNKPMIWRSNDWTTKVKGFQNVERVSPPQWSGG